MFRMPNGWWPLDDRRKLQDSSFHTCTVMTGTANGLNERFSARLESPWNPDNIPKIPGIGCFA